MTIQSDKWQHSFSRYLGFSPSTSFSFGVIPGVCREAMGRKDWVYSNPQVYNTKRLYCWSEFHYKKLQQDFRYMKTYYGAAPFVWDLEPGRAGGSGTLFFLPNDDCGTIREPHYKIVQDAIDSAPAPITFLLPWRDDQIWCSWDKLKKPDTSRIVQLSHRETRQVILARLFQEHEFVYLAYPGTDLYYSSFLDKKIVLYDSIKNYRAKTDDEIFGNRGRILSHLIWGYDFLNENQKKFLHWTEGWNDIDQDIKNYLTIKMLGLDALKSPQELYDSLVSVDFIKENKFVYQEKYYKTYEWLLSKIQEKTPHHSHHDHPHIMLL